MSAKDENSSSLRGMYGNATTYHDSPTTERQDGLPDSMCPSSHAYIRNNVDSIIEFINIRQQQANDIAEAMKELVHRRQSMMATLPIHDGGAFPPLTELGFGGSGLDAFQYQLSQSGLDIFYHADVLDAVGPPDVSIASAALSHSMQIGMTETDGGLPCGEVARHHDKRAVPPAHATSSLSSNLDYGHASEIVFGSCLPGQTLSPAAFIYTASDNRDDHTRSSPPRPEIGRPTVLSFMSGGTKHYRCECGYENARKRGVDRHLESLQHSERKHKCSCGKKFTRYDSLHRHRKRKMQKSMGSKA